MKNHTILPITNYLNQKIVFDLLAVIDDGFTQVKSLSKSSEENRSSGFGVSAKLGLSNAFELLGVTTSLGGNYRRDKKVSDAQSSSEERVHTPTSLFSKLMAHLYESESIKELNKSKSIDKLIAGDFVELKGELRRNSIVSILESIEQMLVFEKRMNGQKKKRNEEDALKQVKGFRDSLTQGDSLDLITKVVTKDGDVEVVLPVYLNYFFNRNLNDLIEGEYTIVGKVVKIANSDKEGINLFRNTGFNLIKQSQLEDMFESFQDTGAEDLLNIPEINSTINAPALLILPIAIYI